ncbi:MAG: hypothetical protein B6247_21325 [Candidatus Parabeggiatoa sp. nov. 2]|nr:MAG: hypothetical protein B6247_21325 [Beggiatoa sp. 4572_84]
MYGRYGAAFCEKQVLWLILLNTIEFVTILLTFVFKTTLMKEGLMPKIPVILTSSSTQAMMFHVILVG